MFEDNFEKMGWLDQLKQRVQSIKNNQNLQFNIKKGFLKAA